MRTLQLKKLGRSRILLPLLVAGLVILSSLGFLIADSIVFSSLESGIAPEVELSVQDFESGSEGRFRRFKESLRTDWERKGWTDADRWARPKSRATFSFLINRLGPINEADNTILISGQAKAMWAQSSFSSLRKNKREEDVFPKDILEEAMLNFSNPAEGIYQKEGAREFVPLCEALPDGLKDYKGGFHCEPLVRISTYKFSGYFPLERQLQAFPFDKAKWNIELTLPRRALEFSPKGSTIQLSLPDKAYNSFIRVSQKCSSGIDSYSGRDSHACWSNKVRYKGPPANSDEWYVIPVEDNVEWRNILSISGFFERGIGTAFFRYVFPLLIITLILLITDILALALNVDLKDVRLLAPPTVILALIFLQSEYHGSLPQVSYLTYLDKLYYLVYVYSIGSLVCSVLEFRAVLSSRRRALRSALKSIVLIRISLGLGLVLLPAILLCL